MSRQNHLLKSRKKPTTPPLTEDLLTININDEIMAVVGTNSWNAIAYGNGKYVAVGSSGYVTTSTDGINWTTPKQIAGSSYTWNGIIYANGKFVACGQYSYIAVSTDGTNWTTYKVDSSATYNWADIAYGNSKFVVVGSSGRISTSSNGTTWTTPNWFDSSHNLLSIAYGNGKFVTMGNGSTYIGVSTNGTTWSKYAVPSGMLMGYGMAFGNGKFVCSSSNGHIFTSNDGQTWTKFTTDVNGNWMDVIYNGEMFIAVGRSWNNSYSKYVNTITTSIDGETWTPTEIVKDENGGIITTVPSGIIAVPAKQPVLMVEYIRSDLMIWVAFIV